MDILSKEQTLNNLVNRKNVLEENIKTLSSDLDDLNSNLVFVNQLINCIRKENF